MDLKKYFVLEDLFELSRKSDAIIEKAFTTDVVDGSFFEKIKSKINQISNSSCSRSKTSRNAKNANDSLRSRKRYSLHPYFENKAHIHVKNMDINFLDKSSCNINPLLPVRESKECNDDKAALLSPFDKENPTYEQESRRMKLNTPNKDFMEDNIQDNETHAFENIDTYKELNKIETESADVLPSNSIKNESSVYQASTSQRYSCIDIAIDSKIQKSASGEMYILNENELVKSTPKNNKIPADLEGIFLNKPLTRSTKRYRNRVGISLDGSFDDLEKVSDKISNNPDRTYVISSSSSEENSSCRILGETPGKFEGISNVTYVINSESSEKTTKYPILQEISKNAECVSDKTYVINSDSHSNKTDSIILESSYTSKNNNNNSASPFNINKCPKVKNSCNKNKKKKSGRLMKNNKLKSIRNSAEDSPSTVFIQDKAKKSTSLSSVSNSSEENLSNLLKYKYKNTFMTIESNNIGYETDKFEDTEMRKNNSPLLHSSDEEKKSANLPNLYILSKKDIKKDCTPFSYSEKRKFPFSSTSSENSVCELDKVEKDSEVKSNISNILKYKCKDSFMTNESNNIAHENEIFNATQMRNDGNRMSSHFSTERKNLNPRNVPISCNLPAENIKKDCLPLTHSAKRKFPFSSTSSESTLSELDKVRKDSDVNIRYEKTEELLIKGYKKIIRREKNRISNKSPRQIPKTSNSAYNRNTTKRNFRSATQLQFIENCNRQSLKDKTEEKRKQREIRVQKTKERRECLQKEREERIRGNEQRLKQKFQQHEEILKQKTDKFKIKSRNRHPTNSKRSLHSTSSKASKEDRSIDNDDFCRNAADSGQKLSKETNGYHDVSLKKVVPTALEGNAGLNPEVSKKHNAILVSCEKTPVEFLDSSDVRQCEKAEIVSGREDTAKMKHFEEFKSIGQHDTIHQQFPHTSSITNSDSKVTDHHDAPTFTESAKKRQKNNKLNNANYTPLHLKAIDHMKALSKQIFNTDVFKKSESSYCLRSAKKIYPNSTLASPKVDASCNICETNEKAYEITPSPFKNKKESEHLCFKCSKKARCDKNIKLPSSSKTPIKNKTRTKAKEKKRCFSESSKENIKQKRSKTTPKKSPQELRSYKISDMHENSFDESKVDPRKIPLWATGLYLKQALIQQHYKSLNVEDIFGVIPDEPINLTAIFKLNKPEYHRRTSSEKWSTNNTPT